MIIIFAGKALKTFDRDEGIQGNEGSVFLYFPISQYKKGV